MVLIEFPLAKRHHLPFHLPKKLKSVKVGKNLLLPSGLQLFYDHFQFPKLSVMSPKLPNN